MDGNRGLSDPAGELAAWTDTRYRLEKILGRGGMGTVFAAVRVADGRRVAIKTLNPAVAMSEESGERMLREAHTASAIPSDHVTQVLDVGRFEGGRPFVVMELLEGQPLDELVRKRHPLPVAWVVDLAIEACVGLAAVHAAGVVHRDLKPSNLFLTDRPDKPPIVKVLDFGISKLLDTAGAGVELPTLTITGVTLGSPQYMSPEQLRSSRDVDGRSDLFSLGVVLHKLLTNRLPFQADTVAAYVAMIAADPPVPVRRHRADVPEGLEAVILQCLSKSPADRYPDVAAVAAALAPFATPEGRLVVDDVAAMCGPPSATRIERRGSLDPPTLPLSGSMQLGVANSASPPRSRGPATVAVVLVAATLAVIAGLAAFSAEGPPAPAAVVAKAAESPPPEPSAAPSATASPEASAAPETSAAAADTPGAAEAKAAVKRGHRDVAAPNVPAPSPSPSSAPASRPKKKALMEDTL